MKPSKSISFICFFFFFFIALGTSQTQDSCSSNLNLNGQVPFDTTTLHCAPVWPSHNFILRYARTSPNLWSFVVSAPDRNAYIAMGFSPNGLMVGSSAIVGWMSTTGTGTIKQYQLSGRSSDQVFPDQGNLQLNSSIIISQSQFQRLYLIFQLNTQQPLTRVIYAVGPSSVFPTSPNFALSEHSDKASTALNYVTGQTKSESPHAKLRKSHGILNMLGWGILMIIGAIVGRYSKQWDPLWFYAHTLIQSFGFILGLAGVICGVVLNNKLDTNVSSHKALGIIILVLGCLQVMAFLVRPDKTSKGRKYWNW
ncbi:cytochrome b561 and DOMON domain-containing protein At3g07570 isoform X2 [Mangifera indica]|nr:cytochrome b561 and DOMON domain-containing protein At3g07570 isoform X2 [Mangifera indica]